MKLLLTSVFGPYGVDDDYGRKEMLMEVLHNQVTREQGLFSMRFNQETYGLYLIAENLESPTTVLDFPSQERFIKEIKKGYDYIGISFVIANVKKTAQMARWIRQYSPESKIIIGGHGTSLDKIQEKISCDYVCRGDGIAFMRELLQENIGEPVRQPVRYSSFNRYVLGMPVPNKMVREGVLMTGVGCVNGCRFCPTSHYFEKQYIPFLKTGEEVFAACREYEDRMGITDFFILDENFFNSEDRARELLALMEKHKKPYSFNVFTSARTILNMGIDFIQRIGIDFVWIGVESIYEELSKTEGIDLHRLVRDLREQGVSVLTSAILFLEHHTKESIYDDINFTIGLKPDFIQFMGLCAAPGTDVFKNLEKENRILDDIAYEEWHGQRWIWFEHPHFTPQESENYLRDAFKKDFDENGPSILRMAETYLKGAAATAGARDEFMKLRHRHRLDNALNFYPVLDTLIKNAPSRKAKEYAIEVRKGYTDFFGKRSLKVRLFSRVIRMAFLKEKLRAKWVPNNLRQPPTRYTRYRKKRN